MTDKKITITDSVIISDKVNMNVFRTGSLLPCARQLAKLAKKSEDETTLVCFAMSSIVMSTATIEASLFEYAYKNNKTTYEEKGFNRIGIALKYKALMQNELEEDFKDVDELVSIRNAIVHNEPDHKSGRELNLAKDLSGDKALWAVETTEKFVESILGADLPYIN